MTDNEIIKALECCAAHPREIKCDNCSAFVDSKCTIKTREILDLINRQKAKIKALQMDNQQLQSDIANANMNADHALAEIERLQKQLNNAEDLVNEKTVEITDLLGEIEKLQSRNKFLEIEMRNSSNLFDSRMAGIRAEAIKEFAERLIRNVTLNNTNDGYLDYAVDYNCLIEDINDLVKEMIGE